MTQDNPFERDEVHDLLELWSEFMERDDHALSWNGRDPILQSESVRDSHQLYDQADKRLADIMTAIVDSLAPAQQAALFRRFGLALVFRYPRLDYDVTLQEAMCAVRLLCAKRGLLSAQYRCRIAADGALLAPRKREARATA